MNGHPKELLAEYVDGSLAADDRATVEAHLASCSVCADEVAVAEQARMALTELPEVPVPFGTEQRILQRTRGKARWESPFAWKAARVAAVAAAVVGVGTAVFLGIPLAGFFVMRALLARTDVRSALTALAVRRPMSVSQLACASL